eukprot:Gb_30160 [translate_table: standard]
MPGFPFYQSTLSGLLEAAKSRAFFASSPLNICQFEFPSANPQFSGKHCNKTCRLSNFQAFRMLNGWINEENRRKRDSNCDLLHNSGDESEHDLDAMVQDFIENGISEEKPRHSKCDNEGLNTVKHHDSLQASVCMSLQERDLQRKIMSVILSTNETDLDTFSHGTSTDCNGTCVRRLLVKHLKFAGHDAALCKVKWQNIGKIPGGEYEYIDIVFTDPLGDRLIIDIGFHSQFEIARPVRQYEAALKLIPLIFVGKPSKLDEILQFMSEAGKSSLKQNCMHFPPWRTLDYMRAKWFSTYKRINSCDDLTISPNIISQGCVTNRCREQLVHLKASLRKEMHAASSVKSLTNVTRASSSKLINRL